MSRKDVASLVVCAALSAPLAACGSCSTFEGLRDEEPSREAAVPVDPREEGAMNELVTAALRALPLAWEGVVVEGEYHAHNPDFLDLTLGLFPAGDRARLARIAAAGGRPLPQASVPFATVLSGEPFARHYDRASHRVVWVWQPLLSGDGRTGLVVAQVEEAGPGGAVAVDHYVLMERQASGAWERRPIPAALRRDLYLDDETAGGPAAPTSGSGG